MIHTLHLFEELDGLLIELLTSLADEDWRRPTRAGAWDVRAVAGHLVDTALRRLTLVRDGWTRDDAVITSEADLLAFVTRLNAEGVAVYGRLSPPLIVDLMRLAARQLHAHLASRPLDGEAAFPVSWAGEAASRHWLDVAREYTERWHHQAQIREAVGALPPIMSARLHAPVLDTFVRAVPYALRHVDARSGARVRLDIEGEGGGTWHTRREGSAWRIEDEPDEMSRETSEPLVIVRIPADLAWRVFTKGATAQEIEARCDWRGEAGVARAVLGARAIVG